MAQIPNEETILTYSVLAGLTPLIPVPFVDDIARSYFRRQLLHRLAETHQQNLSVADAQILADEQSNGCLRGCMSTALIYPIKWIFRKVFFVLEGKRAIDTASATYHFGFLADHALQNGWIQKHSAPKVRVAIDTVIQETDPSFINRAMKNAFAQSKGHLQNMVSQLTQSLRGTGKTSAQVTSTLGAAQQNNQDDVQNVVGHVQQGLNQVPQSHFDRLRQRLAEVLEETP